MSTDSPVQLFFKNFEYSGAGSDLGSNVFTYGNTFKGQTRAHIRVYLKDDCGGLHPTKYGFSLKSSVWTDLLRKLGHLQLTKDPDAVLTVKKDMRFQLYRQLQSLYQCPETFST
ncbi:hypothetical protein AVEN_3114-1 [Araneus ventricosus]|uniref:Transcriptional coactivator p15 (PC4) C-terminal domain-containing protein n=1 Tax=Araneus ventricosus TaxID=182803 RepID=A0A4Y2VZG2_ARAVE|nr:hypothetical protein AVEN_3114-1 [Araneus ventricosus]